MATVFKKLNHGWNAEPNAPDPRVVVSGTSVTLDFLLNASQFDGFSEDQRGRLRFESAVRYRLGSPNDEGWFRGQCRFSAIAPAWGELYEVTGDLRLEGCPDDWKTVSTSASDGLPRHFLFYLRDETFECDASGYALDILPPMRRVAHTGSTRTVVK